MGRVTAQPDALRTLGQFRDILDALATGGIIPSGGYESLRRELLSDARLRHLLPDWLPSTRTSDEAKALILRQRDPVAFVKTSVEPALAHLEEQAFNPPDSGGRSALHCPFCTIAMSPVPTGGMGGYGTRMFYNDAKGGHHEVEAVACPECRGVFLTHADQTFSDGPEPGTAVRHVANLFVLWPRVSSRAPVAPEVPEPYASLVREAGLILTDSPKASAALSRRCLQMLLRDKAGAPKGDLYSEIEWAINNAGLPSHASESLHDLRVIGNMAAHPNMSTATGDYLDVEPGEAEWTLDTLDALFDFYFVGPARTAARKAALAAKLGKPQ